MVKENDFVAIFHSIHRVLKAEKILKQEQVEFLLIPVPRQLTSDCGLALRFSPENKKPLLDVLTGETLVPAELYQLVDGTYLDASDQL